MTVAATIAVPSEAFELGEVLRGDDGVRIELLQFVPIGVGLIPYFWASGDDLRTFETEVRDDPQVASLTALDSGVDCGLYQIEWQGGVDGFLSALAEHDVIVESASGTADEWTFRLRTYDSDVLSRFHNDCRKNDIPLTVQQVRHDPTGPDTDPYELTAKQREAVLLAFEKGYFEVPRGISLTDLGDRLGISRQAASRRMSRGLHTLVMQTLAESEPANAR